MSLSNMSTQAAILLMCLSASEAFTTGKPVVSLANIYSNQRNSIPGRAPVDVFYVYDEGSEAGSLMPLTTSKPQPESLEPFTLSKELIMEELPALQEEHEQEMLRQHQELMEPTLSESDIPALPTLRDLQKFALPCFCLLLSGPLLSLVDTAFVGLASTNAMELAALGPATTLFDCLTWFLSFLNVATTNLYSSALAKGDHSEAEGVVRTGSRIGLGVGLVVMATLVAFCKPILAGYMGPTAAATPGLLEGASTYLTIRALSMPSFLLLGVLQSALLGAKDSVTPLIAIAFSTVVNLFGDYLLVNVFGMGLKGAAIATTAAQWAATAALLFPARKKLMANGKLGLMDFKRKSAISAKKFLSFSVPVVLLLAGKLGVYGVLTQAAARVPGQPTPLAAHQLILSLFLFLCPFVEVINQTAQTFLPPFFAPVKDYVAKMKQRNPSFNERDDAAVKKWKAASGKVSINLIKACFVFGAAAATAGSVIPKSFGQALTGDVAVQEAIKPLAKYLWWSTFLMGPMSATEGILLAKNKAWFLAAMYTVSTAIFPYVLLNFGSGSIAAVWTCFSVFQGYRATMQTLKATEVTPGKVLKKAVNIISAPFTSAQQGAMA